MFYFFYALAALFIFQLLIEQQSETQFVYQRQLILYLVASLVWPLLAIGFIFENRYLLLANFQVIFEIDFSDYKVESSIDEETLDIDEVDPETI